MVIIQIIASTIIMRKNNKVEIKKPLNSCWEIPTKVLTAKIDARPTSRPEIVFRVFLLSLDFLLAKEITSNYLLLLKVLK